MARDLKSMFNDPEFAKIYKTGEKATGIWASELVQRAHLSDDLSKLEKLVILDNACGSGIVSQKIMDLVDDSTAQKVNLICADFAEEMVNVVRERIQTNSWLNAKAVEADAQDTKLPSSHFTHIFFSFGIMAIPDPQKCMQECNRMLAPGGLLAITTWESVGWYADAVDAFATNPKLPPLPSPEEFLEGFSKSKHRWDRPQFVQEHFQANGFIDVQVDAVPGQTSLEMNEVKIMFPGMLGVIYNTIWSEEQSNALKDEATQTLDKFLNKKYGTGPIRWDWVGICGIGRKPK